MKFVMKIKHIPYHQNTGPTLPKLFFYFFRREVPIEMFQSNSVHHISAVAEQQQVYLKNLKLKK